MPSPADRSPATELDHGADPLLDEVLAHQRRLQFAVELAAKVDLNDVWCACFRRSMRARQQRHPSRRRPAARPRGAGRPRARRGVTARTGPDDDPAPAGHHGVACTFVPRYAQTKRKTRTSGALEIPMRHVRPALVPAAAGAARTSRAPRRRRSRSPPRCRRRSGRRGEGRGASGTRRSRRPRTPTRRASGGRSARWT
jgi:hypothetical protein